ncbi:MAG TPA: hypothetical protein VJC17_02200 [Candidatus Dojkabacteria bacterium]|nr:hypothetical protein [Candidatus Dojkabacteria bacterium]
MSSFANAVAAMLQRLCPPGAFEEAFLRIQRFSLQNGLPQEIVKAAFDKKGAR